MDEAIALPVVRAEPSWLARARRGERDALERLARETLPYVQRLLGRLLGPRADLEDLVQNVYVELLRALPGFRGDSRLSTFVGGIVVRVARRAMRPTAFERHRASWDAEPGDPAAGPDERVSAARRLARVRAALDRVGERKRVAFLLWALEGMSPEQIAELTGASVAATRSRIFYAQRALLAAAREDPELAEWLVESERNP
ncbi:MAG: sigma-70 family RNA polymerase sigma factor [Myxococcota bacterium]|nr:sigma-70 family RNA polymerase sigma factor [Myxococcota bacterium]MDW8362587.1 sigma-70 family RNA polymerase sigma factor [Myxococcales bacterium]